MRPADKRIKDGDMPPTREDEHSLADVVLKMIVFPFRTNRTIKPETSPWEFIDVEKNLTATDMIDSQIRKHCFQVPVYITKKPQPNTSVIIYSHGNGEVLDNNLKYRAVKLSEICKGLPVVVYDYCGYGDSVGRATEASVYESVIAVSNWLSSTYSVPPNRQCIVGWSLGTAPSIYLAAHKPCACLALISPLLSVTEARVGDIPALNFFDSKGLIGKVECPILLSHGALDNIIPVWHTEKLYDLAVAARDNDASK